LSTTVTRASFAAKWRDFKLKERSASQEHFIDLCRLLGTPTPGDLQIPSGVHLSMAQADRRSPID
jgi:hypothetical protein